MGKYVETRKMGFWHAQEIVRFLAGGLKFVMGVIQPRGTPQNKFESFVLYIHYFMILKPQNPKVKNENDIDSI